MVRVRRAQDCLGFLFLLILFFISKMDAELKWNKSIYVIYYSYIMNLLFEWVAYFFLSDPWKTTHITVILMCTLLSVPCMHIAYCEPVDCPRVSQLHVTLLSLLDLAEQHELFTVIHLLKLKNKRCNSGVGWCVQQISAIAYALKFIIYSLIYIAM